MTAVGLARFFLYLASAAFAMVAVAIWASPDEAARVLSLSLTEAAGRAVVRADLGGLLGGLAVLLAMAARTVARPWIAAPASILAAVVIGRAIGWLDGGIAGDGAAMVVEITLIAALAILWRGASHATAAGSRSRRAVLALVVPGAMALAAAVGLSNENVQRQVFAAAASRMASTVNSAPLADDALRVAICGSSAPLPSARRAKACVAVFAGGKYYVIDAGPESVENLVLWGIPLSSIGGVLLTHFHSDHIGDLGELNLQTWAAGRPSALPVYGGPGVDAVVEGFNAAYRPDQGYRTAHHTARVMPPETWPMLPRVITLDGHNTLAKNRTGRVFDDGALRITAIEVDHAPIEPAYAYRFDYKGRSAVITGDLKYHEPLAAAAAGTDLIVSEAIAVHMTRALGAGAQAGGRNQAATIMHDIEDYHVTPEQAARIANTAGATLLVFYHLLPSPDGPLARRVFAQGLRTVRPSGWTIAEDGSLYTLPLGSDEVQMGRIDR